jgi:hypothetical protein
MRPGRPGSACFRLLRSARIRCVVAAPSKLQRPTGDRVKTDARDALHLARLLRLGEIVAVKVASMEEEAARDLVRAREGTRQALVQASARNYRPGPTSALQARWDRAPAEARLRGQAGNERLHHQWVRFIARKKRPVVANVAIDRELAGWCWSLAVMDG